MAIGSTSSTPRLQRVGRSTPVYILATAPRPYLDALLPNVPVYYPSMTIGASNWRSRLLWTSVRVRMTLLCRLPRRRAWPLRDLWHRSAPRRWSGFWLQHRQLLLQPRPPTARETSNPDLTISDPLRRTRSALSTAKRTVGPGAGSNHQPRGLYIGDTWKATRNLIWPSRVCVTEYESGLHDANHLLSQGLNLAATDSSYQREIHLWMRVRSHQHRRHRVKVSQASGASRSGKSSRTRNAPAVIFQPRFGLAYRINNRTAARFGYAMYKEPTEFNFTALVSGFEDVKLSGTAVFRRDRIPERRTALELGVPQATFSRIPFPASNPLVAHRGQGCRRKCRRIGGSPSCGTQSTFEKAYNDRLNFSVQRQLPVKIRGIVYLLSRTLEISSTIKLLNNTDPVDSTVHRPRLPAQPERQQSCFYQYGSQTLLPDRCTTSKQVPLGSPAA